MCLTALGLNISARGTSCTVNALTSHMERAESGAMASTSTARDFPAQDPAYMKRVSQALRQQLSRPVTRMAMNPVYQYQVCAQHTA